MKRLFLVLLSFIAVDTADARPVSYPGGATSMIMNDGNTNSIHIHYSPTATYSVGYKGEYWRKDDYMINAIQLNNLVKRWNGADSQANVYLKSGVGVATPLSGPDEGDTGLAAFTGMGADWETRRYFTSYENRVTHAGDINDFFTQSARVGVAPYIGDYGDLHTWLMVQVDHKPEGKDPVTVTPLVRLFKGINLVEAGISNQGDVLFNWVARF
jgi:hypothetical protein